MASLSFIYCQSIGRLIICIRPFPVNSALFSSVCSLITADHWPYYVFLFIIDDVAQYWLAFGHFCQLSPCVTNDIYANETVL